MSYARELAQIIEDHPDRRDCSMCMPGSEYVPCFSAAFKVEEYMYDAAEEHDLIFL